MFCSVAYAYRNLFCSVAYASRNVICASRSVFRSVACTTSGMGCGAGYTPSLASSGSGMGCGAGYTPSLASSGSGMASSISYSAFCIFSGAARMIFIKACSRFRAFAAFYVSCDISSTASITKRIACMVYPASSMFCSGSIGKIFKFHQYSIILYTYGC